MSDDATVDLAYVTFNGLRVIKALVEATTMPLQSHTDPVFGLNVKSLGLVTGKMEWYASVIDVGCSNTASKKCAGGAHQMRSLESRCRQKAKQLLV